MVKASHLNSVSRLHVPSLIFQLKCVTFESIVFTPFLVFLGGFGLTGSGVFSGEVIEGSSDILDP